MKILSVNHFQIGLFFLHNFSESSNDLSPSWWPARELWSKCMRQILGRFRSSLPACRQAPTGWEIRCWAF
jgi:hypothetical protein